MDKKIKLLVQLREKREGLKEVIANLEQEIIANVPNLKLEGSTKTPWGSVTTKLTRKLDYPVYKKLLRDGKIPENLQFVDLSPKIDLKKLRALDLVDQRISAECVTVKPVKAVIKVAL